MPTFQAALGVNYEIPLNMKVVCYKCDGSRNEMGYQGNICPYCEGTGIETIKVGMIYEVVLIFKLTEVSKKAYMIVIIFVSNFV